MREDIKQDAAERYMDLRATIFSMTAIQESLLLCWRSISRRNQETEGEENEHRLSVIGLTSDNNRVDGFVFPFGP